MAFGTPRILAGGIVEYPRKGAEPPPDIQGYMRDPSNNWKFHPMWSQCKYRSQNQHLKQCGSMTIISKCGHEQAPNGTGQDVTYNDCCNCTLKR